MRWGIAAVMMTVATPAWAACSVSADPGAVARPIDAANQADANMIASMSMLPRLLHVDYARARQKPSCDLGSLGDAAPGYELFGDDRNGRRRTALSQRSGDPVATLVPYVDLIKMLAASKAGKAADTEGYVLAVVAPDGFTGWRYYTAMPDTAVLRRDMADALAGHGTPIFRSDGEGKTTLFMPKH